MTRSGLDVQITPVCLGSAEQRCVFCEDFANSYHLMRLVSYTSLGCGCSFQQEKAIGASMAALREGLAPPAPASTLTLLSPSSPHLFDQQEHLRLGLHLICSPPSLLPSSAVVPPHFAPGVLANCSCCCDGVAFDAVQLSGIAALS